MIVDYGSPLWNFCKWVGWEEQLDPAFTFVAKSWRAAESKVGTFS